MSIYDRLHAHINEHHELAFVDFMHMALYDPQWGYYNSSLTKIGANGDFITAPELTPLFGQALANQCQQVLSEVEHPTILEFGAGTGSLCVSLLRQLERLGSLPETYNILELSADMQNRQKKLIQTNIPHLAPRIKWLDRWPSQPFSGVILANEIIDAMPVHHVYFKDGKIYEGFIELTENETLKEYFKPCTNEMLLNYIQDNLPALDDEYLTEVNLFIDGWVNEIGALLKQGVALILDYGFPQKEYYHQERKRGTLMCHYRHRTSTNPLENLGQQDITAHVDFTAVANAAVKANLHVAGYTNQASFLLANGITELLHDISNEAELYNTKQAIKKLTLPTEMGELFKVIALTKQFDAPLKGFALSDKRGAL